MTLALARARFCILTIALTYMASAIAGIAMVHSGNRFALAYRDRLVNKASASDPAARALSSGRRVHAMLFDFSGNLFLGAVPSTISGLGIVTAYPLVAFRGWVGGIVSVDDSHKSRLIESHARNYYLGVLVLQLLPFSLTGGAGVYLGLSWYRNWRASGFQWSLKLPVPRGALLDVVRIYALATPLFLLASAVEFLA